MSYLIGAYQYFDNQFINDVRNYQQPKSFVPVSNLLAYLDKNHPRWLWIMKNAGRLYFFQDIRHYTIFLPDDSLFSDETLMNFDKEYCLRLFNKFVVRGWVTKDMLDTSSKQQITSLKSGESLFISDSYRVDNEFFIAEYDLFIDNVCIHKLKAFQ